jgi:hypothetical protein
LKNLRKYLQLKADHWGQLAANWSLESTTPVVIPLSKIFIDSGVLDSGGKLASIVNDAIGKFFAGINNISGQQQ